MMDRVDVRVLQEEGLHYKYELSVHADYVQEFIDSEVESVKHLAVVPGYRKGEASIDAIKQHHKSIETDAISKLFREATSEFLKEKDIELFGEPQLHVISYSKGKELIYRVEFDAKPEIPELDISNLNLQKIQTTITDEDVEKKISEYVQEFKYFETADTDHVAEMGDEIVMDFEGSIQQTMPSGKIVKKKFKGGSAKDFKIVIGSGKLIKDFDDQLLGLQVGDEKSLSVRFPDDYHAKNLAGRDAVFDVAIRGLSCTCSAHDKQQMLDKMNTTEEEFDRKVRNFLESDVEQKKNALYRKSVFDHLDSLSEFDVPISALEVEKKVLANSGTNPDEVESMASKRVRSGLMMLDYTTKHNLNPTQEQIATRALELCGYSKSLEDIAREYPNIFTEIQMQMMESAFVNHIVERISEERKISCEDLIEEVAKSSQ